MVVTGVASLKEGKWSCYRGGQFKGDRMVMLQRWFNGGSGYGGGQVEGEWSCYRGDHFKEGIMVILQRWPV